MTHKVCFKPVDIEIDVEEGETILNAAFRQGVMLMHGCKEGQCSACKSYLLSGDMDMARYSTFALADYEHDEGYVLLCRSYAYSDLEIELINYDEDMLRSGIILQEVDTVVVSVEALTHDMRRLVLRLVDPVKMAFSAGQYVDITIPGTQHTRSYSMANAPSSGDQLEFLIKIYPGGRFSGLLDGRLQVGEHLRVKGPYGMSTLRAGSQRDLVLVGGGAGMAPLLAILRSLAEEESRRKITYYYGARKTSDLFYQGELEALQQLLPNFTFVPALSDENPGGGWTGEQGMVTEVLERLESDLREVEVYLCGPPPMIDAGSRVLITLGIDKANMYADKFTSTADTEE